MVLTVEARGLADLTSLASNPPSRPAAPSPDQAQPLTLYIVRVPGSQDVFLTPWKPRDRVVNAQDVQSSLYFLHVDAQHDDLVTAHEYTGEQQDEPALSLLPSQTNKDNVRRKPLPTPPTSPAEDALTSSPSPREPWSQWSSMPMRKPVSVSINTDRYSMHSLASTDRDVRPDLPSRKPVSSPRLNDFDSTTSSPRNSWSSIPARKPVLPRRSPDRSSMASGQSPSPHMREVSPPGRSYDDAGQKFTLIRRDAATGEQWNVARIHDPPVDEICSSPTPENKFSIKRRKNAGAPLYLDIDNEAYLPLLTPGEHTFKRRMWMDGSRHADHSYSTQHVSSTTSNRSKGYAFVDPWGTKCDFTTSSTGNALRCRRGDTHTTGRVDVSELRFNLPTLQLHSKTNDTDRETKRRSYFADTTEKDPHALGRERAGGGFAGRETKLGKLIVHAAGQEMLDLVVAANMGLWWRAYERTGAR